MDLLVILRLIDDISQCKSQVSFVIANKEMREEPQRAVNQK